MSSTNRQNRLLVAEDWKRVYQSFRNADFQSYDFDNLRRTMISYIRENYPEDFNDYIESSEYLALIDLIAFLGQNLSFRIDLNARENFIELAERRESILRLARLLSYNVKRNQAANGLLKLSTVTTTEAIFDSNNINLSGQTIAWNDPTNTNWSEQIIRILNAAFPVNNTYGRPIKRDTVAGILTEQYRFNAINTDIPIYKFSKTVEGLATPFEIVSTNVSDGEIVEETPLTGNSFAMLYRDDGRGPSSSNTGFFVHFRQGSLDEGFFTIDSPTPNQVVGVDANNINNTDIWLYQVDTNGVETDLWTKVEAVEGNNVIYNSLSKSIRNIYAIQTRINDQINLIFSDGIFGNLPKGRFKIYYRTSSNRRTIIQPKSMQNISIRIPYLSRSGTSETLTLTFSLKYIVDNGSETETNESIRTNAPSTYYTQNRMITGEDYNVAPLAVSQEIVKVKSVNRTSSGISRYFDLIDTSGKYSTVNLYGSDGVLYQQFIDSKVRFNFANRTDIENVIINTIEPVLKDRKTLNFYYKKFPIVSTVDLNAVWDLTSTGTNLSTGYLKNDIGTPLFVGTFTSNNLRYLQVDALCKFVSPDGFYFDSSNNLVEGDATVLGASTYKWVKVASVYNQGTEILDNIGPIVFNDVIPDGAILSEIKPKLSTTIPNSIKTQMIDQMFSYNTFGLRYDVFDRLWKVITNDNLNIFDEFSTARTGNTSNQNLDSSWILLFETNGDSYTVTSRGLRYVFESDSEIKFYYDSSDKIYDSSLGRVVKDKIQVMSINTKPDNTVPFTVNYDWQIINEYRDRDGYIDTKKIEVGFFDSDDDGVVDDIQLFDEIVNETVNQNQKYIFQKKYVTQDNIDDFRYVNQNDENIVVVNTEENIGPYSNYANNTVFYIINDEVFKILDLANLRLSITSNYRAYLGRDQIKFYYIHSADSNTRIDPSSSNIIDTYLLTRQYDTNFRRWLADDIVAKPLPPSSDALFRSYGQSLNAIKSISDEVIYHPVKYKVLFGSKAKDDLRATFKVVKNNEIVVNDNDVKTRVISAINKFFSIENWDFGETFYFSELSTYIMNELSPDIVTIVIVPLQATQAFGSLFEIKSETDEIFVSSATVDDVEIIDAITATKLQASGTVVTSSADVNTGIQSESFQLLTPSGGYNY